MNIFEQYGIREVADVTLYSIHKKKDGSGDVYYVPALYLDTLKVSSIEKTADNVWAEGGIGNARLISWDYGKQINVTLEDALCTPASLGLCWNGVLSADWKDNSVEVNTDVCFCRNPVNRLSRMEKAIFPRDSKEKRTISELLPKLNEDTIDNNLDILRKSSVVDGTIINGNGIVKNHTYRWKMAIESGIKSIAQVPDRFFDVQGRSYPIDWNRKVSVTNLPTYNNYKDAIIYKINSCDQIEVPKAKIIYDESMESNRINLIYNLQSIFSDDEIDIVDLTVKLPKADSEEDYDTFTYKDVITLNKNGKIYVYADVELYQQQLDLIKEVAYSATHPSDEDRTYKNVNTNTNGLIRADGITLQKQGKFYGFREEIPSVTDSSFSGTFFNKNDVIIVEQVAELSLVELQELYNGIGTVTQQDIVFNLPNDFSNISNTYSYNTPADTFTFKDIICLTKGEGASTTTGILIDNNFISQILSFVWSTDSIEQIDKKAFMKILSSYYLFIEGDYLNKFYTYNASPTTADGLLAGFLGIEFDTKYYDYLSEDLSKALSTGNIVSSYLQNRATTSLFTNLKEYSLIPDELGSIDKGNIPFEKIENANYLAIIIDVNNDYHALIGVTKKKSTYLNTAYDDSLNPITWYRPETAIDTSQFKGLDLWLRFQSINEMIYFLITKYERDIEDIIPSNVNANESKILWGSGDGIWAVNKQVTTVEKNEDSESIKKQGKLWSYINPRTMSPYEDDYWFHQGEPIYIKSLTIAPKNKKLKANRITVKADQWPGMYMMIGETYIRNRDTGEDERMQIKFPLCKIKSDQTITLEAGGDPTTFTLDLEVARPASGTMMEITSYEIATKLYEGENGCFYSVDGSTEVLSE